MKRKVWFYLFWIYLGISLMTLTFGAFLELSSYKVQESNIGSFLDEYNSYAEVDGGYVPAYGYIPDAKTAVKVGGAIIDGICKPDWALLETVSVEYESVNRLWKVQKGYLPYASAIVVLDQDTGKVLAFVRQKM